MDTEKNAMKYNGGRSRLDTTTIHFFMSDYEFMVSTDIWTSEVTQAKTSLSITELLSIVVLFYIHHFLMLDYLKL